MSRREKARVQVECKFLEIVPSPFSSRSIRVAAVIRSKDGDVTTMLRDPLPDIDELGDEKTLAAIRAIAGAIVAIDDFNDLPRRFGPHFRLGKPNLYYLNQLKLMGFSIRNCSLCDTRIVPKAVAEYDASDMFGGVDVHLLNVEVFECSGCSDEFVAVANMDSLRNAIKYAEELGHTGPMRFTFDWRGEWRWLSPDRF